MKLTSRGEYGLLAMIFLARNYQKGYISAQVISAEQGIPIKYLEEILRTLKQANYIQSIKGQHGGYQLAYSPEQIHLVDIIRHLEGQLAPSGSVSLNYYISTPIEKEEKLLPIFIDIRDYIVHKLSITTLADVV